MLDDTGSPRQDWQTRLQDLFRGWALESNSEAVSAAPPADVPGECLFGAPVHFEGRRYGVLAVAAPVSAAEDVRAGLGLVADRLAARLYFAEDFGGTDEAQRIQWLDNVAETTAIVAHEFNNFLNGIMLHLALLKQEAQGGVRRAGRDEASGDGRRGPGEEAAGVQRPARPALAPTDLNDAARCTGAKAAAGGRRHGHLISPKTCRRWMRRAANWADSSTCCSNEGGGAMQNKPGTITLRTRVAPRKVVLRFEDTGPALEGEALTKVFEPFFLARPGVEPPGLAVCHTLARRLHASIRAENSPAGGMAFVLEFTPAAAAASA